VAEAAPDKPHSRREVYIDAFRGLMALVMVQGHLSERLLSAAARANPVYRWQVIFHGSTAPGFLFASGFVAGLPRAPISLKAGLRRARRLLFVLGVGYALQLPYFSVWKIALEASPRERAALFQCDALHLIAVTQLFVLALQAVFRTRWTTAAAVIGVAILAAGPGVWASGVAAELPLPVGSYVDKSTGSRFPVFPFSTFVLAGTVAGAAVGRQEPRTRHRRAIAGGLGLLVLGLALAPLLQGVVDFWGVSPSYTLIRMGGLLLLLRLMETACTRGVPGMSGLALLGHETLQVYVFHLYLLFGSAVGRGPLSPLRGSLGFLAAGGVLVAMIPVLLLPARIWHQVKVHAPREASLALVFLGVAFVWELITRPW
jgi:uncharacterized membrane protein